MSRVNKRISEATFFAGGGKLQRLDKNEDALDARMERIYNMFKQQESMERKSRHRALREHDHRPVNPHREKFSAEIIREELYDGGAIWQAVWDFVATNVEDPDKVDDITMEICGKFRSAI